MMNEIAISLELFKDYLIKIKSLYKVIICVNILFGKSLAWFLLKCEVFSCEISYIACSVKVCSENLALKRESTAKSEWL